MVGLLVGCGGLECCICILGQMFESCEARTTELFRMFGLMMEQEEGSVVGEVGRRTLYNYVRGVRAVAVHSKIAHFDKTKAKRRVAGE